MSNFPNLKEQQISTTISGKPAVYGVGMRGVAQKYANPVIDYLADMLLNLTPTLEKRSMRISDSVFRIPDG